MQYTKKLSDRISHLKSSWQEAKASAELLGILKGEGSWSDRATDISIAEFTRDGKEIYFMPESKIVITDNVDDLIDEQIQQSDGTPTESNPEDVVSIDSEPIELPEIKGTYPDVDHMKRNKIPFCELCFAPFQNSGTYPICPESFDQDICPRLKAVT